MNATANSSVAAKGSHLPLKTCLALAVLLGALCYVVGLKTFHHAPLTTDEGSYIFQANNFLEGRIAREPPPFGRTLQHRMIIQDLDAGWLSRYPPLHSLWLVPGVLLDDPYIMSALAASCTAFLLLLSAWYAGIGRWPVMFLLSCSPFFIFMHGTLLSHTSGLVWTSLLLLGYLNWKLSGQRRWVVVAGLGWALLFMCRPYTAALLAVPLAVDSLWLFGTERSRRLALDLVFFGCAAFTGPLLIMGYNYLAVGDPLTMTFLYYDATEGLGFGWRHMNNSPTLHTFERGLGIMWDNIVSLDKWLLGWRGSLLVAVALVIVGWRSSLSGWMVACGVSIPLGYIAFWYEGFPDAGPAYYAEMLPFIFMVVAMGMSRLTSRDWGMKPALLLVPIVLCGASLAASMSFSAKQAAEVDRVYQARKQMLEEIKSAPANSIVFIPPIPHHPYLMLNSEGLQSEPLVAVRHPEEWRGLVSLFPDRHLFRLVRQPEIKLVHQSPPGRPYGVRRDADAFRKQTGSLKKTETAAVTVAFADEHQPGYVGHGHLFWLHSGTFRVRFRVRLDSDRMGSAAGAVCDIVRYGSQEVLARTEVASAAGGEVELIIKTDRPIVIEPRVMFTGAADIVFEGVLLEALVDGESAEDSG